MARRATAALVAGLLSVSTTRQAVAKLVLPDIPPRGMNSFDIQFARRTPNSTVPVWNETEFRKLATALASQLLPVGYDTIVIDGGWAGDTIDEHGRPTPDLDMWPSARGGKGFKPLADWTHALGLKFGVWTLRGVLPAAVQAKLPVLGADPPATLDEVAQVCTSQHDRWCNW
jgi:alpha-galactosidase